MKQYVVLSGFFQEFKYGKTVPGLHLNRLVEDILRENGYPTKGCTPCIQPDICDLLTDCNLGGGSLPAGTEGDLLYFNGTEWTVLNTSDEGHVLQILGGVPTWDILASLPFGTNGDILYHDGTSWVVLNPGSNGNILTLDFGVPNWAPLNAIASPSGAVNGDILYFNGTTWVRRAIGTSNQALVVQGGVPQWADLVTTGTVNWNATYTNVDTLTGSDNRYTIVGTHIMLSSLNTITPGAGGAVTVTFNCPAAFGFYNVDFVVYTASAQQGVTNLPVTITQNGLQATLTFTVANTNSTTLRVQVQGKV